MKRIIVLVVFMMCGGCEYMKVDKCLDRGGRWDYETKECEYAPEIDETAK